MKRIFSCLGFILLLKPGTYAQKYEAVSASTLILDIAEDDDNIVVSGNGLTWIDRSGSTLHRMPLIEGMAVHSILQTVADGMGGLWVLTKEALGHVDKDKKTRVVFKTVEFGEGEGNELKLLPDGSLFVLLKDKIIKVNKDFTYLLHYASSDKSVSFFKHFDIAPDGSMYIASFRHIYTLSPSMKVTVYEGTMTMGFGKVEITQEGKVMVLDGKRVFQFENNRLREIVPQSHFASNLRFHGASFKSVNDYWLFATHGNVFHYKNGSWKNYTPPAGWNTENMATDMLQTRDGEIWLSARDHYLLRYDGSKWYKVHVADTTERKLTGTSRKLRDGRIITRESQTFYPLLFQEDRFVSLSPVPRVKVHYITTDPDGNLYWSTADGIYRQTNTGNKKVFAWEAPAAFEIIGDEILINREGKLVILKGGVENVIDDNRHYLGWDEISSISFYPAFDQSLLLTSRRLGLISRYDGKSWQKILSIEGKMIGEISNIISGRDMSYIITSNGSVAVFDASGWKWLYRNAGKPFITLKSFVTEDGAIWMITSYEDDFMITPTGQKIVLDLPLQSDYSNISLILLEEKDVYKIFTGSLILRMDLREQ